MKIFVVKKNTLIRASVFVLLIAAAIVYTQMMAVAQPTMSNNALEPLRSMGNDNKNIAITVDTVFGDDYTEDILSVLDEKGVKATFFVTGAWAEQFPQKVGKILKAGHEIANHSYAHKKYTDIPAEQIATDAKMASDILKTIVGRDVKIIRAPYGAYDDMVLQTLYDNGFIPVKWSVDSMDWKREGTDQIVNNVVGNVKNGSIIMFQNNIVDTPVALKQALEKLYEEGYCAVTLSEGFSALQKAND